MNIATMVKDNGYSRLYRSLDDCVPIQEDGFRGIRSLIRVMNADSSKSLLMFPEGAFTQFSDQNSRDRMQMGFVDLAALLKVKFIYVAVMPDTFGLFSNFRVAVIDKIPVFPNVDPREVGQRVRDTIVRWRVNHKV